MKQFIIFQLPMSNPCAFREELATVDDYVPVWIETLPPCLECETRELLEHLFTRFNTNQPENFAGHSLSVSDLVMIIERDEFTNTFTREIWQCKNVGWEKVEFKEDEENV